MRFPTDPDQVGQEHDVVPVAVPLQCPCRAVTWMVASSAAKNAADTRATLPRARQSKRSRRAARTAYKTAPHPPFVLLRLLSHLPPPRSHAARVTPSSPVRQRARPRKPLEKWLKRMSSPLCATMAPEWSR
uniref:Uncharacterized protein n=1 Tax=Aegilops tauschii subsp. strangulata TaxID=200361 RepID=A0A453FZZ9_AEGTS